MKRWMILGALLLMVLTGTACQQQTGENSPGAADGVQENGGLYLPDSALEQQTGGAVKVYPLETGTYEDLLLMGKDLLLVSREENVRLQLLTGENLGQTFEAQLSSSNQQTVHWLLVDGEGAVYFDEAGKDLVFLNSVLREISRMKMPEDMTGLPQMSSDRSAVYYGTKTGIFGLDLQSGVARMIREQHGTSMCVTDLLFEGNVLRCSAKSEDGTEQMQLIDAATGERMKTGEVLAGLCTGGRNWFLTAKRSAVTEWLTGDMENVRYFWPAQGAQTVFYIPEGNTAVAVSSTQSGSTLDFYTLGDGLRVASVTLPGVENIRALRKDHNGKLLFLAYDRVAQTDMICKWDTLLSAVSDANCYFGSYYTSEQPDTEALEACRQQAAALAQKYGVQIRIWEDALQKVSGAYTLEPEHLEQAYAKTLPLLEKALSQFPQGFFKTLAKKTATGKLQICLVRSISGVPEEGTLARQSTLQYWNGGNAYLVLAMSENAEQDLYHGLMHAIDTRVLSVCTAYYEWDRLNPEGFSYDNDYIKNLDRSPAYYLEEDTRAFVDAFSMSFSREDRARVMEFACMAGNEAYFKSPIMQQKLRMLCQGIRQAFDLETDAVFLWEQYLQSEE